MTTQPLKITVNGTDRTANIPFETIVIEDVIGEQINAARFRMENGGAMGLAELQAVIVSNPAGTTRYFAGYIQTLEELSPRQVFLDYELTCVDYSWDMEHPEDLVDGAYSAKSDRWIIQNAVAPCIPDIDCTTYVEQVRGDTVSIEFDHETPREVLNRLAALSGAEWYVDYGPGPGGKKAYLHYFDAGTNPAPFTLSDAPNMSTSFPYEELKEIKEAPQANKVIVIGAGVTATRTKGLESDYGRWLITVLKDDDIITVAQAEVRGDALLEDLATNPAYTLVAREPGLVSGQDVTLINALRGINTSLTIRKITTTFEGGGGHARFNVEMGKYVPTLAETIRDLLPKVNTAPATPTTPSHSTSSALDGNRIYRAILYLDWADNTELDLVGYQVEIQRTGETKWEVQRVTTSEAIFEGLEMGSSYKARVKARDWAGNESDYLDFNSGNAISMLTNAAPAVPTGLSVVTGSAADADGQINSYLTVSWNANSEADFGHYELLWSIGGSSRTIKTSQNSHYIFPVAANVAYSVRVKAVDTASNASSYCTAATGTTAKDTAAPAVPTGLTVTAGKKNIRITVTKNSEADWAGNEFHVSTTSGFTPSASTLVHSGKTTSFTYTCASYVIHYVKVRAYDTSGNFSAYTSQGSATPQRVGGGGGSGYGDIEDESVDTLQLTNLAVTTAKIDNLAVTTAKIGDLAVTTAKIGDLAVTNAKIDSLAADKITAGTITATISIQSAGTIGFVNGPQLYGSAGMLTCSGHIIANLGVYASYDVNADRDIQQGLVTVIDSSRNLKNVTIDATTVDVSDTWNLNQNVQANSIYPETTGAYNCGTSTKKWAEVNCLILYEGDHVFEEKHCVICGKPFHEGENLVYHVIAMADRGTRAVPAHIDCAGKR